MRVIERHETQTALATNACAYGSHRVYRLGESFETYGVLEPVEIPMALTGSVLAYEDFESTEGREIPRSGKISWQVVVIGLRSGRVLHRVPTGVAPAARLVGDGSIEALVVKGDGAVAWIVDTVTEDIKSLAAARTGVFEVHALDKTGSRLLARGSDMRPKSLVLVGSKLYWTQGGKQMSTTLE